MNPDLIALWKAFLEGHWTTEKPTKEGTYMVAGPDGLPMPCSLAHPFYFVRDSCYVVTPQPSILRESPHPWSGFYWSEPVPPMPEASLEQVLHLAAKSNA